MQQKVKFVYFSIDIVQAVLYHVYSSTVCTKEKRGESNMQMVIDSKKFYLACADKCKSVSAVAVEAGLSGSTQARITKGDARLNAKTLGRLAKVLGIAPKDLLKEG